MNTRAKRGHYNGLYEAILSLRNVEECIDFFEDLCTMTELTAMEQRFQVAKFLHEGKIYNEILAETGASSATKGGYDLVFSRTEAPDGEEKA